MELQADDTKTYDSLGSVQMFRLANAKAQPDHATRQNQSNLSSMTLPHALRAQQATATATVKDNLSPDEHVMKILVSEDIGWNLQNFMKKFKENGGSGLNLVQLKAKLADICDYARRGEDSHPKYYLKLEYKNN